MITVFNNTKQKFTAEVNDTFNNRDNRRVSVRYGKLRLDVFVPSEKTEEFSKLTVNQQHDSSMSEFAAKTRLYHSNKEFLPICVVTKSDGGHFLILAHTLLENERLINVEYKGVFALTKDYKKGSHIATVASFRTDRPSTLTILVGDKNNVREIIFTGDKSGKITRTIKSYKAADYTKHDLSKHGAIKPYRPKRPTHLIFTHASNLDRAESIFTKNFTVVGVQNAKELNERISQYKKIGFTAASFFVDQPRNEVVYGLNSTLLNAVKNNFRLTHLVFEDEFTKNESLKPKPPVQKNGQGKRAPKKLVGTK